MNEDQRDPVWGLPEDFDPSGEYAEGGYITGTVEGTVDAGELIVPLDADIKTIRRLASMDKEQILQEQGHSRAVIIGAGRRNGKELEFQIAQLAYAAGITVAELDEALRRVDELAAQAAAAHAEMLNAMIQTINEQYAPGLAEAWEEIREMMEEYADADEPEEEDRHDGAVKVRVTWLLPVPTLYELYGQGVDHGGPGPSRLTLTRVTDDGLRRAETGQIRKGDSRMKKCKGFDMVEAADLDAAITWAKNIRAEDPEKEPEIKTLRDVLVTGLTYARVVAANMGGLPCFAEGQTPEERKKAMAAAAAMAKRPDGGARKNRRKKGTK